MQWSIIQHCSDIIITWFSHLSVIHTCTLTSSVIMCTIGVINNNHFVFSYWETTWHYGQVTLPGMVMMLEKLLRLHKTSSHLHIVTIIFYFLSLIRLLQVFNCFLIQRVTIATNKNTIGSSGPITFLQLCNNW